MTLDAPTLSLIRRVLCAHAPPTQPLSALLPPLTQHHPAIDLQLYALLAIICRDYIDTWYTAFSSDRALASELVRAAAALATELERRSTTLDLPHLLLDALPALLARHITDHRLARARAPCTHLTPAQLFHNLQPHPALAPAPAAHNYNKLLAHALLAALLPDATLPSPCARVFLRDLVAALALGGAVERMSEPAVMYSLIATLLERPPTPAPPPPADPEPRRGTPAVRIPPAVETALTAALLVLQALRALGASLLRCQAAPAPQRKPLLAMAAVWLLPVWFGVRELQPWLWGVLCLLLRAVCVRGWVGAAVDGAVRDAVAGVVGGGGGVVVAEVLGRVRGVVFPGNAPMGGGGAGEVVEVEVVRGRAVEAIVGRVPEVVWRVWVGGEEGVEGRRRWVREWCVDVWADKEVNRHLWYAVLDLLVAGLVPELVEGGEEEKEEKEVGVGVEGQ